MKKLPAIIILIMIAVLAAGCGDRPPPNPVQTLSDLHGRDIGALGGTPAERLADEYGTKYVFGSAEELMFHLLRGTIDSVIMEATVAAELVSETQGVRILSEPLFIGELRFAIAVENGELLRAVNTALNTLRGNGTLRGLNDMIFSGRRFNYVPPEGVVQRPGYLSLAVSADSPPFSYRNEHGEFSGLDIYVARAICDLLGVELRIIEYDSWELIRAVRYGRADLAAGWLPAEGEEQLISISEPYSVAEHVVIVRR